MRAVALRYALAPACVLLAVLVHFSPAGSLIAPAGLFVIATAVAAWFGGAGPGFAAAVLGCLALTRLVPVSYPLLGGLLDLPRFTTFSVIGLAVGWWSHRRRQTEAALRESEKLHALLIDASDEGFWDWIPAGDKHYVSPRLLEIFGFAPGTTFAGRAAMFEALAMPPEDRAALHRRIGEHFAGKTARVEIEFRILAGGEVRWIHARGLATRDSKGEVIRWSGAAGDVTARKRAEGALRVSEERHALAMQAAGDGHTDWDLVSGEFYISPRLLEIVGHPPDAAFADRADWVRRFPFHPDDRPKWEQAMAAHFAGRESHFRNEWRIVVRGEVRWTSFHFLSTRDADGKPVRWTGSIGDITEQKRVEEALRASEERISLAMEASEEGYIDCDVQTDRFIVSERMREIFEVAPGTRITYRSDFNQQFRFCSDADAKAYGDAMRAMSAQGGPDRYEFEFRVVLPSGKVKWIWTRSKVTRDAEGRALRRVGVVADVTARRRAEEALRESEERFARAVAGSSDGVWDIDLVGRTVYFSPRTRELCGLPPGPEMVPLDGWFENLPLHPEDLPRRFAAVNAHLSGKAPAYDGEFRFLQPDGVYRWRHLHGVCVRDADGKPLRMAGSMSDVDDRRRAEDALRESEQRYELAMAASESGYWDWDVPANRYFVSPRAYELAGFPRGTTWATRDDYRAHINMHPEDLARWEAGRQALFAGTGERLAMEVRYMVNGEPRWHMLNAICKRDGNGKVIRWTGSATDITERKVAEQGLESMERQLRQAQRLEAMGTLAGGIAHDFNNILGAILGYGEMAQRDAPKGSRLARDLDNIVIAGERGRALVDRVLAFSRSAVGERVPVHVERVVREALDLVMAKLPPSVTVRARLRGGAAAVLGDATQVHQVVANLTSNAVHAMPSGGTLRVELAVERVAARAATIGALMAGEYVVLTVADTGTGIAPEILDHIFDPFFTTKEVGTGTGLGLSLVHGIVTELGGGIDVASKVGSGSAFTVYLPRWGEAADAEDETPAELPRGDGQRVLIVDDEEPLVELAARALAGLGYVPTGFTSSTAALAAFRAAPERFDALLTDERMPGMSGSTLIREVRSVRNRMPIVLMSGYAGSSATRRATDAGADEVLKKPLSERDLAASLARMFR